jgi:FtsZ-binding cell division protein ZapB
VTYVSGLSGLRDPGNSITLAKLPAVGSPPRPPAVVPAAIQILVNEGWRMTRGNTWAILAVAAALSLPFTACKDTQTLQENERLKTQVAELQKENGQMGNEIETVTAARDALTKENETLKAQLKARKTKHSGKKAASKKRHQSQSSQQP